MRVLHLGCTGNLGTPTFGALRTAGHDVTAFVRSVDRLRAQHADLSDVAVIEGDALDAAVVQSALDSQAFDAVVSTAGCVDNSATTRTDAAQSTFCRIFDNVVSASERARVQPLRALFLAGLTILDIPGVRPATMLQSQLVRRVPQYVAHEVNYERLCSSDLDWTLVCPGSMVDAEQSTEPLRLSASELPPAFPRRRGWMLRPPASVPFVLLPLVAKQAEMTLPYADVAHVLVEQLGPGAEFSRKRLGIANPKGRRLRKSPSARASERRRRADRGMPQA